MGRPDAYQKPNRAEGTNKDNLNAEGMALVSVRFNAE
jgi:hypothetical protein